MEKRDCKNCKHYVISDSRTNWGNEPTSFIWGCESWDCKFEPREEVEEGNDNK